MITFDFFGPLSKELLIKDKNAFIKSKKCFFNYLNSEVYSEPDYLKNKNEEEIDSMIKEKIIKYQKKYQEFHINIYLYELGLNKDLFTEKEIDNITQIGFKYETWAKIKKKKYEEHIRNCIKKLSPKISKCFQDKGFIDYTFRYSPSATKYNMSEYAIMIRNYFILDMKKNIYEKYRNKSLFNEIKNEMKEIYPSLKEQYQSKNIFDKIYNLFFVTPYDLDNKNETMIEIFKNYNNKKEEDERKSLI